MRKTIEALRMHEFGRGRWREPICSTMLRVTPSSLWSRPRTVCRCPDLCLGGRGLASNRGFRFMAELPGVQVTWELDRAESSTRIGIEVVRGSASALATSRSKGRACRERSAAELERFVGGSGA